MEVMQFNVGDKVRVCSAPGHLWDDVVVDCGHWRSGRAWYKTARYSNLRWSANKIWHTREWVLGLKEKN